MVTESSAPVALKKYFSHINGYREILLQTDITSQYYYTPSLSYEIMITLKINTQPFDISVLGIHIPCSLEQI